MMTRIGDHEGNPHWAAHVAWAHLRMDTQKLTTDMTTAADTRVIAADRAAILESRNRVGRHLVDVTV